MAQQTEPTPYELKKIEAMKRELALLLDIMVSVDEKIQTDRTYRLSDTERTKANRILYLEDKIRLMEQKAVEEARKKKNAEEAFERYLQEQEAPDADIDEDAYW